ncbi:MAG: hypothetical protein RI897_3814 [Verrucomicrobiota bacterium]
MEGEGDEDSDERDGDCDDGEADFVHGLEGRGERWFTGLDMAEDIFEDDDGVIDHDTDGEDEGEHGEDIDRVIHGVEDGEDADDGDWDDDSGDEGGA